MSTPSENVDTNESPESKNPPVTPPKRRGRKRKSEIVIRNFEEIVESSPPRPTETVSRRGRPRKKVNYYELANPENVEELPPGFQSEIKYFQLEHEEIKAKKRKTSEQSSVPEFSDSIENKVLNKTDPESENVIREQSNCCDEKNIDGGILKNNNSDDANPLSATDSEINNLPEKNSSTPTTSTPKLKDKRYNYTGETVKMMNTLFTLFSNKSNEDSNSACNNTNGTSENDSSFQNSDNSSIGNNKRPYRKYKKSKVKEEDIDDGSGNVTCAVCSAVLDKNLWSHHKQRYHNNLAWRIGDPPLDLSDQSFVMHTLNMLYKKKKPLYCDKCGEMKKSVVGFLSHQSTCRKSEEQLESVKIACEICGRKMLPVSMSTHMKFLHSNNSTQKDEVHTSKSEGKSLPTKRSAAKKALKIIENVIKTDTTEEQHFTTNLDFGSVDFAKEILQKELEEKQVIECKFKCDFLATDLEEALKHSKECEGKPPQGFACRKCLQVSTKLDEIIYHIELDHDVNIEVEDDSPSFETGNLRMPSFLNSSVRRSERVLFPGAFDWTYKFQEDHFSDLLFENFAFDESNWPLLPPDAAIAYLPKMSNSCDVARTHVTSFVNPLNKHYPFKRYKLFESELHQDNKITLFCGGPITSMAWLPIPCAEMDENQVLAVSVLKSPDERYSTGENYREATAVQFWNFGRLKNREASLRGPKLVFNLACDFGPIWHMEWCPSGCYNLGEGRVGRMGLLAVAASDSVVYVYSVPFFKEDDEANLFYKPKPVIKLLLQRAGSPLLGGLNYYPTKISWSKASGHNYIAVGYTNGFVALFNLKSNSFMMKFKDADGITCFLPYKCFQAHSHSITALALYHLHGGHRWLMTGSLERGVNLWDLECCDYPITSSRKNIVTDGFWLSHWLCYITSADEGSTSVHVTTTLKQSRDYMCEPNVTLTFSPSTISTISGSEWLNGMLHGNTVGEIVAMFPHQLLQVPELRKILKTKRLLFGYVYLIDKEVSPEKRVEDHNVRGKMLQNLLNKKLSVGVKLSKIKCDNDETPRFYNEPVLYDEAQKRYGLLFCDNKMESYDDFPKSTSNQLSAFSKSYGITHPNRYPLSAVNKLAFNPNRQASLYYASGYQAGFVRISWMEFLKGDQQIK